MTYQRTQFGWVIFWAIIPALLVMLAVYFLQVEKEVQVMFPVMAAFFALVFIVFGWATITVDDQMLVFSFGIGLIKKRIAINDIEACKQVRNKWYYGWGVRFWIGFILYNVTGLDAVEITVKGKNRRVRLGTDDASALSKAINAALLDIR